jgi:hypothetical protein
MSLQQLNDIIRSRNELKIFEETKKQDESTHHAANNYSYKYRVFKTVFLVFAWISYGINSETTRISFEDLKILLDTNYYYISLVMIMRDVGFLFTTLFVGILMDRWLKYSDLFMAFAKLLMITGKPLSILKYFEKKLVCTEFLIVFVIKKNISKFFYTNNENLLVGSGTVFRAGCRHGYLQYRWQSDYTALMDRFIQFANKRHA